MKRIELLKKTGIYFTAIALSAVIGTATPTMTVFASEEKTEETETSSDENKANIEGDQSSEENKEKDDEGDTVSSGDSDTVSSGDSDTVSSGGDDTESSNGDDTESSSGSNTESSGGSNTESSGGSNTESSGGDDTVSPGGGNEGQSGVGDEGAQTDGTNKDNTSDSGNGSGENPATETPDQSQSGSTTNKPSQPGSGNTGNGSSQSSSNASSQTAAPTTAEAAVPTAPSEAPAADTQTNQPQQTSTPVDPTGKYKDKGTTLEPGETPTGYNQALTFTGSNADLIASQNIVSGLSIMKDNFRFYTVDKVPAVAPKEQPVYEDMDDLSREIGMLAADDIMYILSEEDDDWLYVESGNVRGFVPEDAIKRGSDSESKGKILSFAEERIPASENKAFTFKRCTTKSTVVDKNYAVADVDTSILEATDDSAREIGHLAPGSLCYVLLQTDEKWAYVESGNVRGFARTANLTTGSAAKKIVQQTGEVSMISAEEYVAPADNKALYYTLNSVKDGTVFSSIRTEIVEEAAKYIGNPYVWGGTSLTNGADCSGFVQSLYSLFGYSLPRVADAQSQYGTQIPVADAAPGDLIFFAANGYVYHVALYAGDGMTIEAATEMLSGPPA